MGNHDSYKTVNRGGARQLFYKYFMTYWYLYLGALVIGLVAAYYYNWYTTPLYSSKCTLLIKTQGKSAAHQDLFAELDDYYDLGGLENEVGILTSRAVISKALQELDFDVTYMLRGNIKTSEMYRQSPIRIRYRNLHFRLYGKPMYITILDSSRYSIQFADLGDKDDVQMEYAFGDTVMHRRGQFHVTRSENFNPDAFSDPANEKRNLTVIIHSWDQLTDRYLKRLNIETVSKKSTILELKVTDPVPEKAGDFLNKLTEVYMRTGVEHKNELARNTLKFIDDQLALVSQQVDTSERSVEQYKSTIGIADMSSEAENVVGSAKTYDQQIAEIDMKLSFLNYLEDYVKKEKELELMSPASIGINDILLQRLIEQLNDLRLQRQKHSTSAPEENPLIKNLDVQILNTKSNLLENIRSIKGGLEASRDQAAMRLGIIESKIKSLPTQERKLAGLMRESSINQQLYTYLLQKKAETSILLASTTSDNRVIDMARTSYRPVKPVRNQTYAVAIILALILPAGFIYIKEMFNTLISDRGMLESMTDIPILGMVGLKRAPVTFMVAEMPESRITEAFRSIRTNLQFYSPEKKQKTLLITSSISAEGKSFCSANIAAILALSGKKVVLINGDMRKPKPSGEYNIDAEKGLSNFLSGTARLDEVIHQSHVTGLDIILSGPKPPNPSELIEGELMKDLHHALSEQYQFIIVDSPPVGIVTDSMLYANYADIVIYIVRHNVTRNQHIDFINQLHRENKLRNLCLVMNAVPHTRGGYNYGYGYGNGYGYYEEEKKPFRLMKYLKEAIQR